MCHGIENNAIECEAELKLNTTAGVFGIGKLVIQQNPTAIKYRILPKKTDGTGYEMDQILHENIFKNISLFHSLNVADHGFRVIDLDCFNKLTKLIDSLEVNGQYQVESNETKVDIIGDLNMMDYRPTVGGRLNV